MRGASVHGGKHLGASVGRTTGVLRVLLRPCSVDWRQVARDGSAEILLLQGREIGGGRRRTIRVRSAWRSDDPGVHLLVLWLT